MVAINKELRLKPKRQKLLEISGHALRGGSAKVLKGWWTFHARREPWRAPKKTRAPRFAYSNRDEQRNGGPGRDRTDDLFHAMEARSQLRHRPTSIDKHFYSRPLEPSRQTHTTALSPHHCAKRQDVDVATI